MECLTVTHPHVLHELTIHTEHDNHVNLLGFQRHVSVRHNQLDTRQDTLTKRLSVKTPRVVTVIMGKYPNLTEWSFCIRRDSLHIISEYTLNILGCSKSVIKSYCTRGGPFKATAVVGSATVTVPGQTQILDTSVTTPPEPVDPSLMMRHENLNN